MNEDIRAEAAKYYDVSPTIPDDLAFYQARLPSSTAAVLELGCGTGRVLLPLAAVCGFIQGIDQSQAMLTHCLQKLQAAAIPPTKARVEHGDITQFALGRAFDLIITPYRVFQLLETEAQVDGLCQCVRMHLAPEGTCILNVFHPQGGVEGIQQEWESATARGRWEVTVDGVRLRCEERWLRLDAERHLLYLELVYRRYIGGTWVEDAVLQIPRRCYAPDEFAQVILEHGFRILQRWGGYAGERYGEGPELVVQFSVNV
jgi:SAM-dependent methyltransferase